MLCFYFLRYLKFFFVSSLTHWLRLCCLFPHTCGFPTFPAAVDFEFNSVVMRKDTLYDLTPYKFVKIYLCVWSKMGSLMDNIPCSLEKNMYSALVR